MPRCQQILEGGHMCHKQAKYDDNTRCGYHRSGKLNKTSKPPERHSAAWHKAVYAAMREDYGDEYRACPHCGWPTHKRYTCRVCRDEKG